MTSNTAIVKQNILHVKSIGTHRLHVYLRHSPLKPFPLHPFFKTKNPFNTVDLVLELPLTQENTRFLPLGNLSLALLLIFHGILEPLVPSQALADGPQRHSVVVFTVLAPKIQFCLTSQIFYDFQYLFRVLWREIVWW